MDNQILSPGATLQNGKYSIVSMLGQGGFGITYLADQKSLNRKVAIKEFYMKEFCNRDATTSSVTVSATGGNETVGKFREKFLKEAYNLAKLTHPNIVRIIDVFEENNTAYYVMEYADGGSLADKVKSMGYLPEPLATRLICEVASALAYIHKRHMTHLDVKPGNIMLGEDDRAVLIDFGLSKQYDNSTGNQTSTTPVGISEGYAPMEQYMQSGVGEFSPETDIYALGATYYKLLTGKTPPCANIINDAGVPVADLRARGVSNSAVNAITKAMEPRKRDRFSDADEFVRVLQCEDISTTNGGAPVDTDEETRVFGATGSNVGSSPAAGGNDAGYGQGGSTPDSGYGVVNEGSSNTKKWLIAAIGAGVVAIIGVVIAIVSMSGGSSHEGLASGYDLENSGTNTTTTTETSTVTEAPAPTPAPVPSVPADGYPSSANCTVSGNIAGFGHYTLVFHDTWGEISPGEAAKEGRLTNLYYDSSTGYLSATATTPSGREVGSYQGTLSVRGGVYQFTGTFFNTKGKGAAIQMSGR